MRPFQGRHCIRHNQERRCVNAGAAKLLIRACDGLVLHSGQHSDISSDVLPLDVGICYRLGFVAPGDGLPTLSQLHTLANTGNLNSKGSFSKGKVHGRVCNATQTTRQAHLSIDSPPQPSVVMVLIIELVVHVLAVVGVVLDRVCRVRRRLHQTLRACRLNRLVHHIVLHTDTAPPLTTPLQSARLQPQRLTASRKPHDDVVAARLLL